MKFRRAFLYIFIFISSSLYADITSNLVAYYNFENNINDQSQNSNNLKASNSSNISYEKGIIGKAYSFNGIDNQLSTISPTGLASSNGTVSYWVKTTSTETRTLLILGDDSVDFDTYYNSTGFYINGKQAKHNLSNAIADGSWKHIVVTFENDNTTKYYLNGILQNTFTNDNLDLGSHIFLGHWKNKFLNADLLDEVKIYNRVLNQSDILELYNLSINDGLVAHYTFDETLNDNTTNNNNLEVVSNDGSESYSIGKVNKAYSFNGIDNHLKTISPTGLNSAKGTITYWIKATRNYNSLLAMYDIDATFDTYLNGSNNFIVNGISKSHISVNANIIDNTWHHIAVSFEEDNTNKFYLDGELKNTFNNENLKLGTNLYLGHWQNNFLFNGMLDDIRIYDKVLSKEEINLIHNLNETPNSIPIISGFTKTISDSVSFLHEVGSVSINSQGSSNITSFSLTGDGSSNFIIDNNGLIKVSDLASFDYTKKTSYILSVTASNDTDTSKTTTVTINLSSAPVVSGFTKTISDSISSESELGSINITSSGSSNITSFNLTGEGSSNFVIDNSGLIKTSSSASFDYSIKSSYILNITASNDTDTSALTTVVVNLTSAPLISGFTKTILESTNREALVGSITINNKGSSNITSFSLLGDDASSFTIDNFGLIKVSSSASFDYSIKKSYTLFVNASNSTDTSENITVNINLSELTLNTGLLAFYEFENNINDSISNKNLNIDSSGEASYVNGVLGKAYSFNGNNNYLKSQSQFVKSISGTISFWAKSNNSNTQSMVIMGDSELNLDLYSGTSVAVGNNENYDVFNSSINENIWKHIVITFNGENTLKTYVNGVLITASTNKNENIYIEKYLSLGNFNGAYRYNGIIDNLRVYNRVLKSSEIIKLFEKVDSSIINTTAPSINGFTTNISETVNSGYEIKYVNINHSGSSSITSFNLSGEGSSNFTIDNNGLIKVSTNASFDYVKKSSYVLNVTASNDTNTSESSTIVINITSAPKILGFTKTISDSISKDSEIGSVIINNKGSSDITAFNLIGEGSSNFVIDNNGLIKVSTSASLNYTSKSSYTLNITANNSTDTSNTVIVTINLVGKPLISGFEKTIAIDTTANSMLGKITTLNNGGANISTYNIYGEDIGNFTIDNSGNIKLAANTWFDYESKNIYNLTVTATNEYNNISIEVPVIIELVGIPKINGFTKDIAYNNDKSLELGRVAILSTGGKTISFSLTGEGNENFVIDNNGSIKISSSAKLDAINKKAYNLMAVANNTYTSSSVNVLINTYGKPNIDSKLIKYISSNTNVGIEVGKVNVNSNGGKVITSFNLIGNGANNFTINNAGSIKVSSQANFDQVKKASYSLKAIANNGFIESNLSDIEINTIAPASISGFNANISEATNKNTEIGKVTIHSTGGEDITVFTLLGEGKENFIIDKNGTVKTSSNTSFNYKSKNSYNLSVTASNGYSISESKAININLSEAGLDTGLVSFYEFDSNINDSISQNNLLSNATTSFVNGVSGKAYSFSFIDGKVNYLTSMNKFQDSKSGSISYWFKTSYVFPQYHITMSDYKLNSFYNNGYYLGHDFNNGYKNAFLTNNSSWNHITYTFDGTSKEQLFINGSLVDTSENIAALSLGNYLQIGHNGSNLLNYIGLMDNLRVYNRVLKEEEVKKLYNKVIKETPTIKGFEKFIPSSIDTNTEIGKVTILNNGGTAIDSFKLSGTDSDKFTINEVGIIKAKSNLTRGVFNLKVSASNQFKTSITQDIVIKSIDNAEIKGFQKTIKSNIEKGEFIGKVLVLDNGGKSVKFFHILGENANLFAIDKEGNITASDEIEVGTYNLKVTAYNLTTSSNTVDVTLSSLKLSELIPTDGLPSVLVDQIRKLDDLKLNDPVITKEDGKIEITDKITIDNFYCDTNNKTVLSLAACFTEAIDYIYPDDIMGRIRDGLKATITFKDESNNTSSGASIALKFAILEDQKIKSPLPLPPLGAQFVFDSFNYTMKVTADTSASVTFSGEADGDIYVKPTIRDDYLKATPKFALDVPIGDKPSVTLGVEVAGACADENNLSEKTCIKMWDPLKLGLVAAKAGKVDISFEAPNFKIPSGATGYITDAQITGTSTRAFAAITGSLSLDDISDGDLVPGLGLYLNVNKISSSELINKVLSTAKLDVLKTVVNGVSQVVDVSFNDVEVFVSTTDDAFDDDDFKSFKDYLKENKIGDINSGGNLNLSTPGLIARGTFDSSLHRIYLSAKASNIDFSKVMSIESFINPNPIDKLTGKYDLTMAYKNKDVSSMLMPMFPISPCSALKAIGIPCSTGWYETYFTTSLDLNDKSIGKTTAYVEISLFDAIKQKIYAPITELTNVFAVLERAKDAVCDKIKICGGFAIIGEAFNYAKDTIGNIANAIGSFATDVISSFANMGKKNSHPSHVTWAAIYVPYLPDKNVGYWNEHHYSRVDLRHAPWFQPENYLEANPILRSKFSHGNVGYTFNENTKQMHRPNTYYTHTAIMTYWQNVNESKIMDQSNTGFTIYDNALGGEEFSAPFYMMANPSANNKKYGSIALERAVNHWKARKDKERTYTIPYPNKNALKIGINKTYLTGQRGGQGSYSFSNKTAKEGYICRALIPNTSIKVAGFWVSGWMGKYACQNGYNEKENPQYSFEILKTTGEEFIDKDAVRPKGKQEVYVGYSNGEASYVCRIGTAGNYETGYTKNNHCITATGVVNDVDEKMQDGYRAESSYELLVATTNTWILPLPEEELAKIKASDPELYECKVYVNNQYKTTMPEGTTEVNVKVMDGDTVTLNECKHYNKNTGEYVNWAGTLSTYVDQDAIDTLTQEGETPKVEANPITTLISANLSNKAVANDEEKKEALETALKVITGDNTLEIESNSKEQRAKLLEVINKPTQELYVQSILIEDENGDTIKELSKPDKDGIVLVSTIATALEFAGIQKESSKGEQLLDVKELSSLGNKILNNVISEDTGLDYKADMNKALENIIQDVVEIVPTSQENLEEQEVKDEFTAFMKERINTLKTALENNSDIETTLIEQSEALQNSNIVQKVKAESNENKYSHIFESEIDLNGSKTIRISTSGINIFNQNAKAKYQYLKDGVSQTERFTNNFGTARSIYAQLSYDGSKAEYSMNLDYSEDKTSTESFIENSKINITQAGTAIVTASLNGAEVQVTTSESAFTTHTYKSNNKISTVNANIIGNITQLTQDGIKTRIDISDSSTNNTNQKKCEVFTNTQGETIVRYITQTLDENGNVSKEQISNTMLGQIYFDQGNTVTVEEDVKNGLTIKVLTPLTNNMTIK